MRLTPQDVQVVRETVRTWGVLSMAADALGCRARDLKAAIARDPDLQAEVDEAMEEHKEALYDTAVKRGVNGGSDAMLGKLLEARLPEQFDSKTRNQALTAKGKPTGVTLRRFEETADGSVVDAEVKCESAAPAAKPAEPLRLGFITL